MRSSPIPSTSYASSRCRETFLEIPLRSLPPATPNAVAIAIPPGEYSFLLGVGALAPTLRPLQDWALAPEDSAPFELQHLPNFAVQNRKSSSPRLPGCMGTLPGKCRTHKLCFRSPRETLPARPLATRSSDKKCIAAHPARKAQRRPRSGKRPGTAGSYRRDPRAAFRMGPAKQKAQAWEKSLQEKTTSPCSRSAAVRFSPATQVPRISRTSAPRRGPCRHRPWIRTPPETCPSV